MANHTEVTHRPARRQLLAIILSGLPIARKAPAQSGDKELVISTIGSLRVSLPLTGFGITKMSPEGLLCVLGRDFSWIEKISLADGRSSRVSLHVDAASQIPTSLGVASARPYYDFAIGPAGESYIPVLGHISSPKEFFSGALIHRASGEFDRFVRFDGMVNVRHLAVSARGEIFALGYDGAFFRGAAGRNCVIHRFTADGRHHAGFSEDPIDGSGPGLSQRMIRMNQDLDRGDIWISRESVYQLMPVSRRLRVFSTGGELLRDITFDSPDSLAQPWIRRVLERPDGSFLVHWFLEARSGNSMQVGRQLALHDRTGRRITRIASEPWPDSLPVASSAGGRIHFLRRTAGGEVHLAQVDVDAR